MWSQSKSSSLTPNLEVEVSLRAQLHLRIAAKKKEVKVIAKPERNGVDSRLNPL